MGVEVGGAVGELHRTDVPGPQDAVEQGPELGVPVPDYDPGRGPVLALRDLDELPGLVGGPLLGGRRGGGRGPGPAGDEVDEHEDERRDQSRGGHHLWAEEAAGPEGLGVGFDELFPGALAALRAGGRARLLEDVDDCGAGDLEAELLELTLEAGVLPARLPGDAEDEAFDGVGRLGPATLAGLPAPSLGLVGRVDPSDERLGLDGGDEGFEDLAEGPSEPDQPLSLGGWSGLWCSADARCGMGRGAVCGCGLTLNLSKAGPGRLACRS